MHLLKTLARGGVTPVTRRVIRPTAPAAGANLTIAPENGRAWQVESLSFALITSSNVANRSAGLLVASGADVLYAIPPVAVQAASVTVAYSYLANYPRTMAAAIGSVQASPIPPIILLPDWSITTLVDNLHVADQIAVPVLVVLEAFVGRTEGEYDIARAIEHRADAIALAIAGEVEGS